MMTRLLFVPDPHSLLWLDDPETPSAIAAAVLRGDWLPPAPFEHLAGSLKVYWQEGLVIISALALDSAAQPPQRVELNLRQRQILKLISDGLTGKQIALRLGLHQRTVFHHIGRLKSILNVSSRAELVRLAPRYLK